MPTTFLQPKKEQLELEHCTEENFVKTNHFNPDPPHEPQEAPGLTIELLHLEKNSRKNRYWGILIYKVLWCFLPRFALFTRLLCSTMCSRTIFSDDNYCTSRHKISSRDETNMSTSSECSARMGLRQIVPFK